MRGEWAIAAFQNDPFFLNNIILQILWCHGKVFNLLIQWKANECVFSTAQVQFPNLYSRDNSGLEWVLLIKYEAYYWSWCWSSGLFLFMDRVLIARFNDIYTPTEARAFCMLWNTRCSILLLLLLPGIPTFPLTRQQSLQYHFQQNSSTEFCNQ
jgi:hypothetical protein